MLQARRITYRTLMLLWAWALVSVAPVWAVESLRIGLTPTFLNERHALISDWRTYMESKLGRPVEFILRDSYQTTIELLHQGRIQAAWLCDCPHVTGNAEFRMLATPLFQGRPYYRSYVIVPAEDRVTRSLDDLKGKVFAYSDPFSNSGYMSPRYELKKLGRDPDDFFLRTFFTHSNRKAIEAVAVGVANAASVNSYIWETLNRQSPALTGRTRVALRSVEYGFPPIVAYHTLPTAEFRALQQALVGMAADAQGRAILKTMNLDGFILPQAELYRPIREIVRFMEQH